MYHCGMERHEDFGVRENISNQQFITHDLRQVIRLSKPGLSKIQNGNGNVQLLRG